MTCTEKKVVIITGGNCGLGLAAAKFLVKHDYELILACRNEEKAKRAVEEVKQQNPRANVSYHLMDLADLSSVNAFVDWFLTTGKPLYGLVNNAAVLLTEGKRQVTKDGFELTFQSNYLGHVLLTLRLLDKLKSSVVVYGDVRILNVASYWHNAKDCNKNKWTQFKVKDLDVNDLQMENENAYHYHQAYKNSKAGNIMFTLTLARILDGTGVYVNTCCPGFVPDTNVFRHQSRGKQVRLRMLRRWPLSLIAKPQTIDQGLQNLILLLHGTEYKGRSGVYLRYCKEVEPADETRDVNKQNELFKKSCDLIKMPEFKNLV